LKTTTPKKIYTRVALLALEKLKENEFKPDILSESYFRLFLFLFSEFIEFLTAFIHYKIRPTLDNKNKLDRESGDVFNFLASIIAKTDGYKTLKRG